LTAEKSSSRTLIFGLTKSYPLSLTKINLAVCCNKTLLSPSYVTEGTILLKRAGKLVVLKIVYIFLVEIYLQILRAFQLVKALNVALVIWHFTRALSAF
jgi:hypothetical protein